ncbi:MAG: replication initiation protein [bacterium]
MSIITNDELELFKLLKNNKIIKKDNDLIFTRCDLSAVQIKILSVVLGQIYKDDIEFKPFIIPAKEFLKIIGLGVENYSRLNTVLKDFFNKPIESFKNVKNWKIDGWFADANCSKGQVEINLNPELALYLLNLKQKFTTYSLDNILILKSKYDMKLYEVFVSVLGGNKSFIYTVEIDQFKKLLNIENMPFYKIKQSILSKINLKQIDIAMEYKSIKKANKTVKLSFYIKRIKEKISSRKIIFNTQTKKLEGIEFGDIIFYETEFDGLDVEKEIKKMEDWILRKTNLNNIKEKDWSIDLFEWLQRSWDRCAWSEYYEYN